MADNAKKVLIAEDEQILARAFQFKLERDGYTVTVASDGKECLEHIAKVQYDVLLLDLVMPVMDGFQVLEKLKTFPHRPSHIFVMSNLSQNDDEARVRALGVERFFIKSDTDLSVIVDEIEKL